MIEGIVERSNHRGVEFVRADDGGNYSLHIHEVWQCCGHDLTELPAGQRINILDSQMTDRGPKITRLALV